MSPKATLNNLGDFIWKRSVFKSESAQKHHNTAIIGPTISFMGIAFLGLQFRYETDWFSALAIGVFAIVVNQLIAILLSKHHVVLGPWTIHVREDRVDAFRESLTLCTVDFPLCIMLKPTFLFMTGFWTVLLVAMSMEMYRLRQRTFVAFLALSLGTLSLWYVHHPKLEEMIFFLISNICVLIVMTSLEFFWLREIDERLNLQQRQTELQVVAENLHQNALLGEHSRTISHELNNLTMVIHMSIANPEKVNVDAIKSSLRQINNINDLVLSDLKKRDAKHQSDLREFVEDICTVLKKMVESQRVKWRLNCEPMREPILFEQRRGALFLVVQNLVQNAVRELHRNQKQDAEILLSIELQPKRFRVTVADNGNGLPEQIRSFIDAQISSYQSGLKFVVKECVKSGFALSYETAPLMGTKFHLDVEKLAPQQGR